MIKQKSYEVLFTDTYIASLKSIKKHGQNIAVAIHEEAEGLCTFPEKKGKPLIKELAGLWSRRVYRQRYRIIYRIKNATKTNIVEVLFVGIRKESSKEDVYKQVRKKIRKK